MSPRRIYLVLRAWWWIVLIVALVAAGISVMLTQRTNEKIRRTFVASAPVSFIQLDNESDDAFERRLNSAKTEADDVLSEQGVASDTRLLVVADPSTAQLVFRASARRGDDAEELAVSLREAFLNSEQSTTVIDTIEDRMQDIVVRLDDLKVRQAQLLPAPVVVEPDPEIERQRSLLEAVRSDLERRSADLAIQIEDEQIRLALVEIIGVDAEDEDAETVDVAALEAELAIVNDALTNAQSELAALPVYDETEIVPEEPSLTDGLDELVLEERIRDLEDEYVALALSLQEESGQATVTEDVTVMDTTPEFQSRLTAGLSGLAIGIVIAAGALVAYDRFRKKVWVVDDLEDLAGLAEVPGRPRVVPDDRPWYTSVGPNRRRREVQTVRAALEVPMAKGPITVGITGLRSRAEDVQDLAADLATSLAVSGRTVLLVDTDFETDTDLAEYGTSELRLTNLLSSANGHQDHGPEFAKALSELPPVMEGLTALPSGGGLDDPTDTISSEPFRMALTQAKGQADVVLVAAPSVEHPVTAVVAQRLDYVIIAAGQGRATTLDVEDAQLDLTRRQANVIGTVILSRYRLRMKAPKETVAAVEKKIPATATKPARTEAAAPPVDDELEV